LYGALHTSLENTISNYKKIFPFKRIYLVSDSKEKSWRKDVYKEYKAKRKKDSDIDWQFVYDTYSEFKKNTNVKVVECPNVEGDDWISFLIDITNKKGESNLVISNDHDIKQLIRYDINNGFITFMIKVISGYISDNIKSVFQSRDKSGNIRGIGIKGAQSIIIKYSEEFGEPDLNDPDIYENFADIIIEKKKISRNKMPFIIDSIKNNVHIIDLRLSNIPEEIIAKMKNTYYSV
jgi:5'-3' exonuclease